jgi:hypothetical protein
MSETRGTDSSVASLRRRLAAVLAVRYALRLTAAWCFAWGVAVLGLRALWGVPAGPLLWGLAGLVPCAAGACILAWRHLPRPAAVRAMLDDVSRGGGLVMAPAEVALGDWEAQVPAVARPRVVWRKRPLLLLVAGAVTFLALGFAVPQRMVEIQRSHPLEVTDEVADLEAKIEVLDEEQVLAEEEAESLRQALRQAADEATGEDPAKTWEALDHLDEAVHTAADEAAEDAAARNETLTKAEALSEALGRDGDRLDHESLEVATKTLDDLLQEIAERDRGGKGREMGDEAKPGAAGEAAAAEKALREHLDALQAGRLTPGMCRAMAANLAECRKELLGRVARLKEAGLIDPDHLRRLAAGNLDPGDLVAFLEGLEGEGMTPEAMIEQWLAGSPGRGGITRGPGEAPMFEGEPTSEEGVAFKEEALPAPTVADLKESRLLGVSLGAPPVEAREGEAGGGALDPGRAGGGSAHTHRVLPKHRGAVERYFRRDGGAPASPAPTDRSGP